MMKDVSNGLWGTFHTEFSYSKSKDLKIVGLKLFELNSNYTINYCFVHHGSTNSIGTKIFSFDILTNSVKT